MNHGKKLLSSRAVSCTLVAFLLAGLIFSISFQKAKSEVNGGLSDWPTFYGDVAHSGFSMSNAPSNNNTLWALSGVGGYQSIPVVHQGKIFVGSTDGKINAVEVASSTIIWSFQTIPHVDQPPRLTVAYGRVYACSYPERKVYCLNETDGSILWNFQAQGVLGCSPTASEGLLYVPSQGGYLYALDAYSGQEHWTYPIGIATSVPAVSNGRVFFGDWSGFFAAVNGSTGQLLWATNFPGVIATCPTVNNGKVFIMQGAPGVLYALNESTGQAIWTYTLSNVSGSSAGTAAVAYGKVYIAPTSTNQVFALDESTGSLIWQSAPGEYDALKHYGALAVADGTVFAPIGSSLFALNATTGSTIWSYSMGAYYSSIEAGYGQPYTSGDCPAIAYGTVFIGAGDRLFAIGDGGNISINHPPVASFIWSPSSPSANNTVTFDASSSQPGWNTTQAVSIVSYDWDFGDGSTLSGSIVSHVYTTLGTYLVKLKVTDGNGSSDVSQREIQLSNNQTSGQELPILNLACASSTSKLGFQVEIKGNLASGEKGFSGAPIQISYSVTGGNSWENLTLLYTNSDGSFLATWTPSVTGYYLIKAGWSGNATFPATNTVVTLVIAPLAAQTFFAVASNSTVSDLNFNSTSLELSFTVSGSSETTGYVRAHVAKSLVQDISKVKVYLDGNLQNYTETSTEDSWIIYFTYHHSIHNVLMNLNSSTSQSFTTIPFETVAIIAVIIILIVVIGLVLKKSRHKENTNDSGYLKKQKRK